MLAFLGEYGAREVGDWKERLGESEAITVPSIVGAAGTVVVKIILVTHTMSGIKIWQKQSTVKKKI